MARWTRVHRWENAHEHGCTCDAREIPASAAVTDRAKIENDDSDNTCALVDEVRVKVKRFIIDFVT